MNENDKFSLEFLQLQRSALIDTQTLFQILIDKGVCTLDEILAIRENVEQNNPDVIRIGNQIESITGELPKSNVQQQSKSALMNQLKDLIQSLNLPPQ